MIERFVSPPSSVGIVDVRPYKNRKKKILPVSERENGKENTFMIQIVLHDRYSSLPPSSIPKKTRSFNSPISVALLKYS